MIQSVRVCRACQEAIEPPEEAVAVAQELGNSGPGWTVWAHASHADTVQLIPDDLLRIMMRIWAAGS